MSGKTNARSGFKRRQRGFVRASSLMEKRIRDAGESRGFAVSRLLTHWADVVGPELAKMARPVEVTYGRGFGATLTVLSNGAQAPMLEMQKDKIRDKVNACYGYNAIHRIRITQTAAAGFGETQAAYLAQETPKNVPLTTEAKQAANGVKDNDLRRALERLGSNVLSQSKSN